MNAGIDEDWGTLYQVLCTGRTPGAMYCTGHELLQFFESVNLQISSDPLQCQGFAENLSFTVSSVCTCCVTVVKILTNFRLSQFGTNCVPFQTHYQNLHNSMLSDVDENCLRVV